MDLTIQRTGLVTSLGHGVEASAAAARAGILRPTPIEGVMAFDEDEMEVPVAGHAVRDLTDGFEQTGRWLQLAHAAVQDLLREGELEPPDHDSWSRTALLPVLPEPNADRFGWADSLAAEIIEAGFVRRLEQLTGIAWAFEPDWLSFGATGLARSLEAGAELLESKKVDRLIVLAVDSWLDTPSLMHLGEAGRIKGGEASFGMMPGEAAACALLSTTASGRARVSSARVETTDVPALDEREDQVPAAQAQGQALGRLVAESVSGPAPADHLSVDINGEEWRAHVWGMAKVAARDHVDLDACIETYPCASFGDVGAVTALAGLCLFERSLERGYATGDRCIVASADENGHVATVIIEAR